MIMKDDVCYNLRTGKWIAGPGIVGLNDIKNEINSMATALTRAGASKDTVNTVVACMVEQRGPIGDGPYACTCNNWGPRFIEDSLDGCCPGCFQWALDHHYEVPTSKLDPGRVTREMIEENTWGINVKQLDKLTNVAAGNDPKDGAGIPRDPDVPSFFHNLDWIPEDK